MTNLYYRCRYWRLGLPLHCRYYYSCRYRLPYSIYTDTNIPCSLLLSYCLVPIYLRVMLCDVILILQSEMSVQGDEFITVYIEIYIKLYCIKPVVLYNRTKNVSFIFTGFLRTSWVLQEDLECPWSCALQDPCPVPYPEGGLLFVGSRQLRLLYGDF